MIKTISINIILVIIFVSCKSESKRKSDNSNNQRAKEQVMTGQTVGKHEESLNLSTPENTWRELIAAMSDTTGPRKEHISVICTKRGLNSIMQLQSFYKEKETINLFKILGKEWSQITPVWADKTNNKALALSGPPGFDEIPFEFIKKGELWYFDFWGGPGK